MFGRTIEKERGDQQRVWTEFEIEASQVDLICATHPFPILVSLSPQQWPRWPAAKSPSSLLLASTSTPTPTTLSSTSPRPSQHPSTNNARLSGPVSCVSEASPITFLSHLLLIHASLPTQSPSFGTFSQAESPYATYSISYQRRPVLSDSIVRPSIRSSMMPTPIVQRSMPSPSLQCKFIPTRSCRKFQAASCSL